MRNSIRVQNGEWIMKMSEMQTKSRPGWWSEKGLTAAKKKKTVTISNRDALRLYPTIEQK
jgi:hypothetical protein